MTGFSLVSAKSETFVNRRRNPHIRRINKKRSFISHTFGTYKSQKLKIMLDRIQEGGPVFMWPIVIVFIIIVALFIRQLVTKSDKAHTVTLLTNITTFILAWGFLGSVIGLIEAFDSIEAVGDVSQGMMAGGLKIAFLTTVFGLFTFIVGRLFILVLNLKK